MSTIPFPPEPEEHATPTIATPTTTTPTTKQNEKPTPRTSPIVWGSLILVFCAYVFVRAEGWSVDTTTWIIMTIIGIGALLLVVGLAVLLRNSRERQ